MKKGSDNFRNESIYKVKRSKISDHIYHISAPLLKLKYFTVLLPGYFCMIIIFIRVFDRSLLLKYEIIKRLSLLSYQKFREKEKRERKEKRPSNAPTPEVAQKESPNPTSEGKKKEGRRNNRKNTKSKRPNRQNQYAHDYPQYPQE